MNLRTLSLLGLTLAGLDHAASAQGPTPEVTQWSGSTFTNAVVGEFAGDLRPCVFVVRNGELWYLFDPGRFAGRWQMTDTSGTPITGVTGLVKYQILDNGGQPTGRDGIMYCTASGLYRAKMVDTTNGQQFTPFAMQFGPEWNNARSLAVRVNTTSVDIAAVTADGHFVTQNRYYPHTSGTGSLPALDHSNSVIRTLGFLDWDHNGSDELVVTTVAGIGTAFSQGELDISIAANMLAGNTMPVSVQFDDELGVVSNQIAYPRLSMAWMDEVGTPTPSLNLPLVGGTQFDEYGTAMSVFDIDADGNSEILVTQRGNYLFQIGTRAPIAKVDSLDVFGTAGSPDKPGALNTCPLLWTNFRGDPQPDLLAFLNVLPPSYQAPAMVFVPSMVPDPGSGQSIEAATIVGCTEYVAATGNSNGKLRLHINEQLNGIERKLHVTVWHQANPYDDPPTGSTMWDSPILENPPCVDSSPVWASVDDYEAAITSKEVDILDMSTSPRRDHYYVDIRVTKDSSIIYQETLGVCFKPDDVGENGAHDSLEDWAKYLLGLSPIPEAGTFLREDGLCGASGGLPIGGIVPNIQNIPPIQPPPKPTPEED